MSLVSKLVKEKIMTKQSNMKMLFFKKENIMNLESLKKEYKKMQKYMEILVLSQYISADVVIILIFVLSL